MCLGYGYHSEKKSWWLHPMKRSAN
jgi:hypothetical protein